MKVSEEKANQLTVLRRALNRVNAKKPKVDGERAANIHTAEMQKAAHIDKVRSSGAVMRAAVRVNGMVGGSIPCADDERGAHVRAQAVAHVQRQDDGCVRIAALVYVDNQATGRSLSAASSSRRARNAVSSSRTSRARAASSRRDSEVACPATCPCTSRRSGGQGDRQAGERLGRREGWREEGCQEVSSRRRPIAGAPFFLVSHEVSRFPIEVAAQLLRCI